MNKQMDILHEFNYGIQMTKFDETDYKTFKKEINQGIKDKKKRKKLIHKENNKVIVLQLIKITDQ